MDLLGSSTGSKDRGNAAIHTSPPLLIEIKIKNSWKSAPSKKVVQERKKRGDGGRRRGWQAMLLFSFLLKVET